MWRSSRQRWASQGQGSVHLPPAWFHWALRACLRPAMVCSMGAPQRPALLGGTGAGPAQTSLSTGGLCPPRSVGRKPTCLTRESPSLSFHISYDELMGGGVGWEVLAEEARQLCPWGVPQTGHDHCHHSHQNVFLNLEQCRSPHLERNHVASKSLQN